MCASFACDGLDGETECGYAFLSVPTALLYFNLSRIALRASCNTMLQTNHCQSQCRDEHTSIRSHTFVTATCYDGGARQLESCTCCWVFGGRFGGHLAKRCGHVVGKEHLERSKLGVHRP
ncbi:hypothetical protein VFPBJ_08951 [Purpureocillium lilacinum]|uniref:Uncharacterized protein n=1 Tax=Purpureocillium lilacinum TaxID=33203 RepID=A0A179GGT7_PURLI|nr:hypothetical protein VFPBJ_08951 [Purpureocillium lilacinum]